MDGIKRAEKLKWNRQTKTTCNAHSSEWGYNKTNEMVRELEGEGDTYDGLTAKR